MSHISDNLAALDVVARTAEKHKLPMPYAFSASPYGAKVQVQPDELNIWATWLGVDLHGEGHPADEGGAQYHATADFDGRPVQFIAIDRVPQGVTA